jgi:hypothetical protein
VKTLDEKFWTKVDRRGPTECWPWIGARESNGYGQLQMKSNKRTRYLMAHRVAYELQIGRIPDGLVIDHLCRNRVCVNASHLEPVTSLVNIQRGTRGPSANCIHGHPFSGENLMIQTWRGRSRPRCRTCRRAEDARRRAAGKK